MKGVRDNLALLVASLVMSGVVQAQDKSVLSHQGLVTNSIAGITLEMKTEPKLVLGSNTRMSGLLVDLIRPQQSWAMLNPSVAARDLPRPIPRYVPPVEAPHPINDDLAVHEPDFALLRLSF